MKKLLLLSLISISSYAQTKDNYFSFSAGFDIKNACIGSGPVGNKPALNWIIGANVVTENIDFGLGFERFKELEFSRKFVSLGYHVEAGYLYGTDMKLTVSPALEWSSIRRSFKGETRDFSTPSINIAFQLDLTKNLSVQMSSNILPRPDIKHIYGDNRIMISNYLKLVYKIQK